MITHGFPSSVAEFLHLIDPLVHPAEGPGFHVVAPSLPGYAFSTPLSATGWAMGDREGVGRADAPAGLRAVRRARRRHRRGSPRHGRRASTVST